MAAVAVRDARPHDEGASPANPETPEATAFRLTEADLARLWAGQRFPAWALVTRQGVPLRVLHPGRPGRGPGPDFRDAIIAPPSGRLLRGDVELHVRASDFRGHGHHADRRYNSVVLHLVFEDDRDEDTQLANGRRAAVVALAPWLRRRAQELQSWLATPRLWREPCHDAIVRLGRQHVLATLEQLGDARFRAREAALADSIARFGPGEALYRALLEALGYGGAGEALAQVADRLPWRELVERLAAAAPEARVASVEALLALALGSAASATFRPANHPARRLAGLARLLVRHVAGPDGPATLGAPLEGPAAPLVAAWTAAPLIGRSRAVELLVNAVLPWAAARAESLGDGAAAAAARACFARLPRPGRYGALTFLEANLSAGGKPLPLDARQQQGLLALYKGECTQGGCGRCALS